MHMRERCRNLAQYAIGHMNPTRRSYVARRFPRFRSWTVSRVYRVPWLPGTEEAALAEMIRRDARMPRSVGSLGSLPAIGLVTPWEPTKSGIATYSRNFFEAAQKITDTAVLVSHQELPIRVEPGVSALVANDPSWKSERLPIYMLGNGTHHWDAWRSLFASGGYVVLHDVIVPDLVVLPDEDPRWHRATYEEKRLASAARLSGAAKGVFVHSQHAGELLAEQCQLAGVNCPPIHVLSTGHPIDRSRERILGDPPVVGSLGFFNTSKRPQETFRALAMVASRTNAHSIVCGQISNETERLLHREFRNASVSMNRLDVIRDPSDEAFDKVAGLLDVSIQLRDRSNGESSGTVMKVAGHGGLGVVTDIGSFGDLPDFLVSKTHPNAKAKDVARACMEILGDPVGYRQRSEQVKAWTHEKTFDLAAKEVIETVAKWERQR